MVAGQEVGLVMIAGACQLPPTMLSTHPKTSGHELIVASHRIAKTEGLNQDSITEVIHILRP